MRLGSSITSIRAGPLRQVVWRSETSLSMAPLLPVVPGQRGKLVATAEACHQSWQLKVFTTNLPRGLAVPVFSVGLVNGACSSSGQTDPFSSASSDDDERTPSVLGENRVFHRLESYT